MICHHNKQSYSSITLYKQPLWGIINYAPLMQPLWGIIIRTSMQPLWGIINIFGLALQLHAKLSTDKLHTFGLCCAATACPSACPSISSHCLPFQQYHQHYLVALGSGSSQPAYQLFPWRIFSGHRAADMAPICFHLLPSLIWQMCASKQSAVLSLMLYKHCLIRS